MLRTFMFFLLCSALAPAASAQTVWGPSRGGSCRPWYYYYQTPQQRVLYRQRVLIRQKAPAPLSLPEKERVLGAADFDFIPSP